MAKSEHEIKTSNHPLIFNIAQYVMFFQLLIISYIGYMIYDGQRILATSNSLQAATHEQINSLSTTSRELDERLTDTLNGISEKLHSLQCVEGIKDEENLHLRAKAFNILQSINFAKEKAHKGLEAQHDIAEIEKNAHIFLGAEKFHDLLNTIITYKETIWKADMDLADAILNQDMVNVFNPNTTYYARIKYYLKNLVKIEKIEEIQDDTQILHITAALLKEGEVSKAAAKISHIGPSDGLPQDVTDLFSQIKDKAQFIELLDSMLLYVVNHA
jgi:hypothetical protein